MFSWSDNPDGSVTLTMRNADGAHLTLHMPAGPMARLEIQTIYGKTVLVSPPDSMLPPPPPLP